MSLHPRPHPSPRLPQAHAASAHTAGLVQAGLVQLTWDPLSEILRADVVIGKGRSPRPLAKRFPWPPGAVGDARVAMTAVQPDERRWWTGLAAAFVVGACLRLAGLTSQVLLDDEWHGIAWVIGHGFWDVVAQFNPHDNSSLPLNLYNLALFRAYGWSELALRLPVVLAGLLSLVLLPILVRPLLGGRIARVFAWLLAIAPFPIFYGRYARGYGLALLLGCSALLLLTLWLLTQRRRYAIAFAVAGALASYAQLFSLVVVFVPLALAAGLKLTARYPWCSRIGQHIRVPPLRLLGMAAILGLALLPLVVPVLLRGAELPWGTGRLSASGLLTAAGLLSGTASPPLLLLFLALGLLGLRVLWRSHPLLGVLVLGTLGGYLLALLLSRPFGLHAGAVVLRYMVVVVPIALMLVALGLDGLLGWAQTRLHLGGAVPSLLTALFVVGLLTAGPLPDLLLETPNNFMNHSAYQGSYRRGDWQRAPAHTVYPAYSIRRDQIPRFYDWLRARKDVHAIVEYPFDLCDYNDIFYYYQRYHGKQVRVGYTTNPALVGTMPAPAAPPAKPGSYLGMLGVDTVLARVTEPAKLKLRTMVDVTSTAALARSGATLLVVHTSMSALRITPGPARAEPSYERIPVLYRSVALLLPWYRRTYGAPVYEDESVVCFRVDRPR